MGDAGGELSGLREIDFDINLDRNGVAAFHRRLKPVTLHSFDGILVQTWLQADFDVDILRLSVGIDDEANKADSGNSLFSRRLWVLWGRLIQGHRRTDFGLGWRCGWFVRRTGACYCEKQGLRHAGWCGDLLIRLGSRDKPESICAVGALRIHHASLYGDINHDCYGNRNSVEDSRGESILCQNSLCHVFKNEIVRIQGDNSPRFSVRAHYRGKADRAVLLFAFTSGLGKEIGRNELRGGDIRAGGVNRRSGDGLCACWLGWEGSCGLLPCCAHCGKNDR